MESKKKIDIEIGDDMLDRDGMIVEPDVRKKVKDYFKAMRMRETVYPIRATYFSNRFQDPGEEYEVVTDDPVGLKLRDRQAELEDEIYLKEAILRDFVKEILKESTSPESVELGIVTIPGTGWKTKLTVIYSIRSMDWTLSRLFKTKIQKPEFDDLVIAGVEWGKPGGALESGEVGDGPCNNAYVVRRSVTSFPGWGRKAYIAAVDAAAELGPDRGVVKPGAEKAWAAISGNLETHPYDDVNNPQTPEPDDDCTIHSGRPVLNASYSINGSPPLDVSVMLKNGMRHFDMLQKHGGKEIVDMAKKVLKIEFDSIFREKYGGE
jgi:hypothetical protein